MRHHWPYVQRMLGSITVADDLSTVIGEFGAMGRLKGD